MFYDRSELTFFHFSKCIGLFTKLTIQMKSTDEFVRHFVSCLLNSKVNNKQINKPFVILWAMFIYPLLRTYWTTVLYLFASIPLTTKISLYESVHPDCLFQDLQGAKYDPHKGFEVNIDKVHDGGTFACIIGGYANYDMEFLVLVDIICKLFL